MCISLNCSVSNIQRHTFREKRSLSEYHKNYFQYIYIPFYPIIGDINITKVKFMIRNQEIEATFILGPLFFKFLVVFKSLQRVSIAGQVLIQNTSSSSIVFVYCCPFLTIFKFSSLKCLFASTSLQHQHLLHICRVYCRHQGQHLMQQK